MSHSRPPAFTETVHLPRAGSGARVVVAMIALGVVLAAFASWYQWSQTRRCLAFYGGEAARRIQVAPRVELWRLDASAQPVRPGPASRADISASKGLVHLRHGLVEDANFTWDTTAAPVRPVPAVALAFFDHPGGDEPGTVVVLRLDDRDGRLEVAGRPGVLVLGRIAAGLRTWLADVAHAGNEGESSSRGKPAQGPTPGR